MISRCAWSTSDPLYIKYHDKEWGKPLHNDRKLFEFLILEGAQAGLNWLMVLKKRENYRKAFDNFDPVKIAKYNQRKINSLLNNEGIIRNKIKIQSAIQNAKTFLKVQDEFGSFNKYIWQFTDGKTIQNSWDNIKNIPATSPVSDVMSKDLKEKRIQFCRFNNLLRLYAGNRNC